MKTRLTITGIKKEHLYSVADLAGMAGMSEGHIRRLICNGAIKPTVKVGAGRGITPEAVAEFLTGHVFANIDRVRIDYDDAEDSAHTADMHDTDAP